MAGVTSLLLLALTLRAAAPAWLLEDARLGAPREPDENGADILRSETIVTIGTDGSCQRLFRYAVRIDQPTGVTRADMAVPFVEGADQILRAEAWLVRDDQQVKAYPRKEWLDRAEVDEATLYSDFRTLAAFSPAAAHGDVFGGEVLLRQRSPGGQEAIDFSSSLRSHRQRFEIRIPKGWTVGWLWLDGPGPEPKVSLDRDDWIWEISDQPASREEFWSATRSAPRLAITVVPPANVRLPAMPTLRTWGQVATWLHDIQDPQCDRNAELEAAARRLTTGLDDPWAKLRALTHFVQERRYIAVNRNNGLGFGYRPRKASEVLAADYGDCKDKSNLLRALLEAAGFRAHLVAAFAGDPDAVNPGWPSPAQFNHAIVAIELPGEKPPESMRDAVQGRLIFFDTTARWIPLGHLPWILQGGCGLLCDPDANGLVRFPRSEAPDEFGIDSQVTLTLGPGNRCRGQVVEVGCGQLAAEMREAEFELSKQQQTDFWARRLSTTVSGVTVGEITQDGPGDFWHHKTTVAFRSAAFGQRIRDEMLLLPLDFLVGDGLPAFPDDPRQHPLLILPLHVKQEVTVELPAGSRPEFPGRKEIAGEYGCFNASYELSGEKIVYRRTLVLRARPVAPERYEDFRHFLQEVTGAERATVIVHLAAE
jgi:transglutaminase-like putative cysteine protease